MRWWPRPGSCGRGRIREAADLGGLLGFGMNDGDGGFGFLFWLL